MAISENYTEMDYSTCRIFLSTAKENTIDTPYNIKMVGAQYPDMPKTDRNIFYNVLIDHPNPLLFYENNNIVNIEFYGDTDTVYKADHMCTYCKNLRTVKFSDTQKISSFIETFEDCKNLTTVIINNNNIQGHPNCYATFYNCRSLQNININAFGASSRLEETFYNCESLTSDVILNFKNIDECITRSAFYGCKNLNSITIDSINSQIKAEGMFELCTNLSSVNIKLTRSIIKFDTFRYPRNNIADYKFEDLKECSFVMECFDDDSGIDCGLYQLNFAQCSLVKIQFAKSQLYNPSVTLYNTKELHIDIFSPTIDWIKFYGNPKSSNIIDLLEIDAHDNPETLSISFIESGKNVISFRNGIFRGGKAISLHPLRYNETLFFENTEMQLLRGVESENNSLNSIIGKNLTNSYNLELNNFKSLKTISLHYNISKGHEQEDELYTLCMYTFTNCSALEQLEIKGNNSSYLIPRLEISGCKSLSILKFESNIASVGNIFANETDIRILEYNKTLYENSWFYLNKLVSESNIENLIIDMQGKQWEENAEFNIISLANRVTLKNLGGTEGTWKKTIDDKYIKLTVTSDTITTFHTHVNSLTKDSFSGCPNLTTLKLEGYLNQDSSIIADGDIEARGELREKGRRVVTADKDVATTNNPNDCVENGFYYIKGDTYPNRPPFPQSAGDYRVIVTSYNNEWLQQIATDFYSNEVYYRRNEGGTWQSWTRLGITKTSELNNDAGFITQDSVPTEISELNNDVGFVTQDSVPSKTSQLVNDSDFATTGNNNYWGSVYSGADYTGGYFLLATLTGDAAPGNHDISIEGIVYSDRAGTRESIPFFIYVRGGGNTIYVAYFRTLFETDLVKATYSSSGNAFTINLYGSIKQNWHRFNTVINYASYGDVSVRAPVNNVSVPGTYTSSLNGTEIPLTYTTPNKTSQLDNDSGFITSDSLNSKISRSGDTMQGPLRVYPAAGQGLLIGSAAITSANETNGEVVLQGGHLRFGGSAWDYDKWAGLKYDPTTKIIYLGTADGSIFPCNSQVTGYLLELIGNGGIKGSKLILNGGASRWNNNYNEGVRINRHDDSSWSIITLGGPNGSETGTDDDTWIIGKPPSSQTKNLIINRNGSSDGNPAYFYKTGRGVGMQLNSLQLGNSSRYLPWGSDYNDTSGANFDYIQIRFRDGWNNSMMSLKVRVTEYGNSGFFEFMIYGYNFSGTASWHQPKACIVSSNTNEDVRIWYGAASNGEPIILLRVENRSWISYPQAIITDIYSGYMGYLNSDNIDISLTNSIDWVRQDHSFLCTRKLGASELPVGIQATVGDNDFIRIVGRDNGSNAGYMEIATADDGNEPIVVRQYTGVFETLVRQLTLLSESGNTELPGMMSSYGTYNRYRNYDLRDTSIWNENTWYPCVFITSSFSRERFQIDRALDVGKSANWQTHNGGFSMHLDFETIGGGWGTNEVRTTLYDRSQGFTDGNYPVGAWYDNETTAVILYLRGGGYYSVRTTTGIIGNVFHDGWTSNVRTWYPGGSERSAFDMGRICGEVGHAYTADSAVTAEYAITAYHIPMSDPGGECAIWISA